MVMYRNCAFCGNFLTKLIGFLGFMSSVKRTASGVLHIGLRELFLGSRDSSADIF